ncbi:helix-turn-helix domain-containing protein [Streptomyces sp. NBC_00151]|uniref:helix-turn-helix domain-containing protein n=1 Tax=Streptomyces sp. NBC_00151 TaxID=2975669 RepID=UPI002DD8CF14|nr:helix-turn-helix transcriptional regulator [Streptomyces sp. NBC_00151]WRZ36631.1 helix-turn-helix domain-containing protein [Streptomyces sp. NBC_00151]WRZ44943.1 helix-turn-helix domain-containing protein [Streptomyces sp. NBC_00151]
MTRSPADSAPQRSFADLAEHLTALRRASRLPQRGLAEAANVSRGAIQRAESGTAPPTQAVLDAYLRACGADEAAQKRARLLFVRGRTAQRGNLPGLKAPAPDFISTKRELGLALALAYERAGAPSLTDACLFPGHKPLPRTTAWRIVNRKGLPASHEQLITFLTVCGIHHPAAQRPYLDAYSHVIAQHCTRHLPPRTQLIRRTHPVPLAHGRTGTHTLTELAAALPMLGEALATAYRSASRQAHRNGTTAPDWNASVPFIRDQTSRALAGRAFTMRTDDRGNNVFTCTTADDTAVYEITSHRNRTGPPPSPPHAPVLSATSHNTHRGQPTLSAAAIASGPPPKGNGSRSQVGKRTRVP